MTLLSHSFLHSLSLTVDSTIVCCIIKILNSIVEVTCQTIKLESVKKSEKMSVLERVKNDDNMSEINLVETNQCTKH